MRRRFSFCLFLPALCLCAVPSFADDAGAPDLVATSESEFAIPFQVDAEAGVRTEVRLYVSEDQGRNWTLHSKAVAPVESFDFRAAGEKEYWFAVRTVDAAGRESPAEPLSAELRVVVDKTPPQVDVSLEPTADGQVAVRWKIGDAQLAAEPLKLSYRTAQGASRELPEAKSKKQGDARSASGETLWRPAANEPGLVLLAEVRDAADNVVVREFPLPAAKATTPTEIAPPSVAAPQPIVAPAAPSFVASTPAVQAPQPIDNIAPPMAVRDPTKPLMVNSTAFELDYDVQRAAAGTISKVEIWGTRDDGRSWVLLGLDDDRQSPCAVNVDTAGMYGFAVVVEAGDGLKGRAPQPGDVPEIRVGVDLTVPRVRLTTAEPDVQGRPCMMRIKWDALDEHLGPQAVTLSYSASPQGPWVPLAQGVPSAGAHDCEFDPQGPDYAYLRIDVRDEAGNVGTHTTTTAIPVEKRQVTFSFAGSQKDAGATKPRWFHVLQ